MIRKTKPNQTTQQQRHHTSNVQSCVEENGMSTGSLFTREKKSQYQFLSHLILLLVSPLFFKKDY